MAAEKLTLKTSTDKNTELIRNKKGQFTKGNKEGNRNGRPKKGLAMSDIINQIGKTKKGKKTRRQIILEKAYDMAENGDLKAIQFIVERLEGKPFQTSNITLSDPDEVRIIG